MLNHRTVTIHCISVLMFLMANPHCYAKYKQPCDKAKGQNQLAMWEERGPERLDQDLLLTDGLGYGRDIGLYLCNPKGDYELHIRAWVRPQEGQWREIRIDDLTQIKKAEDIQRRYDPDLLFFDPAILKKTASVDIPRLIIPIRREGLNIGDAVRIEVKSDCQKDVCSSQVLNHFLKVARYGLLPSLSDSVLFIKRIGQQDPNLDDVNFRPVPGFNLGFTYFHRKRPLVQFLQPGFGTNVSLLGWRDRSSPDPFGRTTNSNSTQLGIGAVGSMFDNAITFVYGWNANVSSSRPYIGVGFSVIGIAKRAMIAVGR